MDLFNLIQFKSECGTAQLRLSLFFLFSCYSRYCHWGGWAWRKNFLVSQILLESKLLEAIFWEPTFYLSFFGANFLASTWFLFSTLALTYSNIVYVFDLKNSNQKYFSLYRCRMKNEELTLLKLFLVFYLAASWISTSALASHGIGNTFSRITHRFAKNWQN